MAAGRRGARDGFEAHLSRRWRTLLVLGAVVALSPVWWLEPHGVPAAAGRTLAVLMAAAQAGALWWMGRRPGLVAAIVLSAGGGLQALFPSVGPGISLAVVCTFAWVRPAQMSLWGLAGAAVVSSAVPAWSGHWAQSALWCVAALLAWSWGALGRARSARRKAENRQAVLEERARIAREVHDVLAHTVSVMVVQAAAADDVFDVDPVQARHAVQQVESSGRQALTELRWFLRTIRSGPDDSAGGPQPGLADVDRLAVAVSSPALQVSVHRDDGWDGDISEVVGLSAYRIVQESLTNVLRHANASRAQVTLRTVGRVLQIDVSDNGDGGATAEPATGHGITGMKERAALFGGSLRAGPTPSGGFRVSAQLPLGGPQ